MSLKDPLSQYLVVLVAGVAVGAWGPGCFSSAFSPSWGTPAAVEPSPAELAELEFQTRVDAEVDRIIAGRQITERQFLDLRGRVESRLRASGG